jgi:hypothetical protein
VLPKAKAVSALRSATALQNLAEFQERSMLESFWSGAISEIVNGGET